MPDAPTSQLCFSLLHRLFLLCDREHGVPLDFWQKTDEMLISVDQAQSAFTWLQREGLIDFGQRVGTVSLTVFGVSTVLTALAKPEQSTQKFPALSGFYGVASESSVGLCSTTLNVWLDQLKCCSSVLDSSLTSVELSLVSELEDLEACVMRSSVDPASLVHGLVELKESL